VEFYYYCFCRRKGGIPFPYPKKGKNREGVLRKEKRRSLIYFYLRGKKRSETKEGRKRRPLLPLTTGGEVKGEDLFLLSDDG